MREYTLSKLKVWSVTLDINLDFFQVCKLSVKLNKIYFHCKTSAKDVVKVKKPDFSLKRYIHLFSRKGLHFTFRIVFK